MSVALTAYSLQQRLRHLQLAGVRRPPVGGEFAFEGGFEEGLTVGLQQRPRARQAVGARVEFRKKFLDLRDDAALLRKRRYLNDRFFETAFCDMLKARPP